MHHQLKIAFGHKARVGKEESCKYLQQKHGGNILRFAPPVYQIAEAVQKYYGLEIKKDGGLLQTIGKIVRKSIADDIFVVPVHAQIKELKRENSDTATNIFIEDLRHKPEYAMLKGEGFITVDIRRKDRPIDRDPNDISEIDLDDAEFDYVIDNDGTLEELYEKLDEIVSDITASRRPTKRAKILKRDM